MKAPNPKTEVSYWDEMTNKPWYKKGFFKKYYLKKFIKKLTKDINKVD
jgi:hypothetical protein